MSKLMSLLMVSALVLSPLAMADKAEKAASEPALAYTHEDAGLQWGPCPPFIPKGCEIAVVHGDPAQPNVDVFFKVPGGFTIPAHWHSSPERMVLVSGVLDVTYEGQKTTRLTTGSYAYGPAKRSHQAVCAKGAPCVLFIAFVAPLDAHPSEPAAK